MQGMQLAHVPLIINTFSQKKLTMQFRQKVISVDVWLLLNRVHHGCHVRRVLDAKRKLGIFTFVYNDLQVIKVDNQS